MSVKATEQNSAQKENLTQNGHSRSFKVTYLEALESRRIVLYNNVGLIAKGSKDTATKSTENRRFSKARVTGLRYGC